MSERAEQIVPPRATGRPWWALVGGGGLVIGSLVELGEVLFWSAAQARGDTRSLFALNSALLLVAAVVVAMAAVALARGHRGRDGIVGRSGLGRIALLCFAVLQLVAKLVTSLYYAIPPDLGGAALAVSAAATGLAFVAVIIAAVVVARTGIARRVARWSLFAVVAVGPITAMATTFAPSFGLAANILAVVIQGAVG